MPPKYIKFRQLTSRGCRKSRRLQVHLDATSFGGRVYVELNREARGGSRAEHSRDSWKLYLSISCLSAVGPGVEMCGRWMA